MARERKVTGLTFLETLFYSKFDHSKLSLDDIAESLTRSSGEEISKQAVDKRFTPKAVSFFMKLVEKALQEINPYEQCYNFLVQFTQLRIKDSTSFQIPGEMACKYPGSGGASSKASVRIQFEYDFKTGKVLDLSLHAFNKQDQTNSEETIRDIIRDALVIRDLGYISIKVIKGIKQQKAFFISRLATGALVYECKNGEFENLNFEKLYHIMQAGGLGSMEREVYVTRGMEPVRMIVELVPPEIVEKRIRKTGHEAKKKGRELSREYRTRAKFNIFITNIPAGVLSLDQIHEVYKLRWQVELVFKIWKSIGGINKTKAMKIERFECCLYAKLLWILVNWLIVWDINRHIYRTSERLLSFYKAFKSLKENIPDFKVAVKTGTDALTIFIDDQLKISSKHHLLDKKKNKSTLYKQIKIM